MNAWYTIPFFILGALVAWPLIPVIIRRSRGFAETRGHSYHQTHSLPVPRFGGLALVVVFVVTVACAYCFLEIPHDRLQDNLGIMICSLAMFGLGFADDIRPLGARKKLIGQVLIALAASLLVSHIQVIQNPLTDGRLDLGWWGVIITVVWLVAFTNLINLIDGIDGLAAGLSLMLMLLLAYVGSTGRSILPVCCSAGMAGALVVFLRYNFPPAKVYLGDGGAYFLGFLIGILAMRQSQKGTVVAALVAPLFALALPILDVTLAILRRGLKGVPIFRPDQKHLHHRLIAEGFSRRDTVLIMYGFSVVCLLAAFGVFWSNGRWVPIAFGLICLLLLFMARKLNFAREWFAVGRVLGDSLEVRKESQYALALGQWFELEAERSPSPEALWKDFEFASERLGFCRITLEADGRRRSWALAGASPSHVRRRAVVVSQNPPRTIAFEADAARHSPRAFDLVTELAGEFWLRGTRRWQSANEQPFEFPAAPTAPD